MGFELTISVGERPQTHALRRYGHLDRHLTNIIIVSKPPIYKHVKWERMLDKTSSKFRVCGERLTKRFEVLLG